MRERITSLVLVCLVALALPLNALTALADEKEVDGGSYVYNGSTIVDKTTSAGTTTLAPGSSVTTKVGFTNSSSSAVNVYLSDSVLSSLEDSYGGADGAAYTYSLSYSSGGSSTEIYNSDTVTSTDGNGLSGVSLSKNGTDYGNYYYLGQLAANSSGTVYLTIGLDGETTVNSYQMTNATTALRFAVENTATDVEYVTEEGTEVVNIQGEDVLVSEDGTILFSAPRTSDETQLWLFVVILGLCSLGLGVCFALKVFPSGRKERRQAR